MKVDRCLSYVRANRRDLSLWLVSIVAAYSVAGFLVIPAIIKWQMRKQLPAFTHRNASVESVRLNPYAFSFTVRGLKLTEPDGKPFASLGEFYVNYDPLFSIFTWSWNFTAIRIAKPAVTIVMNKDGTFNFSNLISPPTTNVPPPATTATNTSIPRLIVDTLAIEEGSFDFTDNTRPVPFQHRFGPIRIALDHFQTKRDFNNPYSFTVSTGMGELFKWKGDISVNPFRSYGTFQLTGIPLKQYAAYVPEDSRWRIVDGTLGVESAYRYDSSVDALALTISNAAVRIADLKLRGPDTDELLIIIPSFVVSDTEMNLLEQTLRVGRVETKDGFLLPRLNKDGTINLVAYTAEPTKEKVAQVAEKVATNKAWVARVDEVRVDGYRIRFEDLTLREPGIHKVDQLHILVKNISNQTNVIVPTELSFRANDAGNIKIAGTNGLAPVFCNLQFEINNLPVPPAQPYLGEYVYIAVTNGVINSKGRFLLQTADASVPMIGFAGDFALENFAAVDTKHNKPLVHGEAIQFTGIQFETAPTRLHINELRIARFESGAVRLTDGKLNAADIVREDNATNAPPKPVETNAAPATAASTELPLEVTVDTVVFEDDVFRMDDEAISPPVRFAIQDFSGTIKQLSSKETERANVDLRGTVNGNAPFTITGQINPLSGDAFTDVQVQFKAINLATVSPYAGKYVGFPIEQGALSLGLKYRLNKNELTAENLIEVDQLTLGDATGSPDAPKLPVKLALALLTDVNGQISLDVPISGNTADPKFKIGKVILQVFMNILTKAATAPFALLGSLVGGGEDFSSITFEPGLTRLELKETKKLDGLAKALKQRPKLKVCIAGSFDPVEDRIALARVLFREGANTKDLLKRVAELPNDREQKSYAQKIKEAFPKAAGMPFESAEERRQRLASKGMENRPGSETKPAEAAEPVSKETPFEQMERKVLETVEVPAGELQKLAAERGKVVEEYLLQKGELPAERVAVVGPEVKDANVKPRCGVNLLLQ